MTTAFDRWVSEAIQDLGGDGAKYLREKSNVVSLTEWKISRYNGRVNAGKHDELNPLRVWLSGAEMPFCLPAESQTPKRVFCFLAAVGRLCGGIKRLNRHMGLDGFWRNGIARGCCSQDGRRIPSGAPVDRLHRCTDAVAPVSKEAANSQ